MDHPAIVAGLVQAKALLLLQEEEARAGAHLQQLHRGRQPHDAAADHAVIVDHCLLLPMPAVLVRWISPPAAVQSEAGGMASIDLRAITPHSPRQRAVACVSPGELYEPTDYRAGCRPAGLHFPVPLGLAHRPTRRAPARPRSTLSGRAGSCYAARRERAGLRPGRQPGRDARHRRGFLPRGRGGGARRRDQAEIRADHDAEPLHRPAIGRGGHARPPHDLDAGTRRQSRPRIRLGELLRRHRIPGEEIRAA